MFQWTTVRNGILQNLRTILGDRIFPKFELHGYGQGRVVIVAGFPVPFICERWVDPSHCHVQSADT